MAIKKLTDYVVPETVNPYIAELAELAEGDVFEELATVKLAKDGDSLRGLDGVKQNIQAGARANGFTARLIDSEVVTRPTADEPGQVRLVFKATALQKSAPRGPRKTAE